MENVSVVIVGAGPSGLAMGLSLARHNVKSVILEKELEITQDPRAVYLNGDAIRILHDLGITKQFEDIGHAVRKCNFHRTTFQARPFFVLDMSQDILQQALPTGVAHIQPKLESAMIDLVNKSNLCTLKRGCTVESHDMLEDGIAIHYSDAAGSKSSKCSFLIGADGKRGVVRKHFLERDAHVRLLDGRYTYEGTWVAANLKIRLPNAQSHPYLPFWQMGMTPEDVYDLYWPEGWHFCNPPGKPTACGRIGPEKDRFWRWEFAEPDWNDSKDATALLWEHLTPKITRDRAACGRRFPNGPVAFPRDCIDIWRCKPFTFSQKVVNKWFDRRRILIGDAAHTFPPFGGEGMSSGLRDAHQLAWRIAMVESTPHVSETTIICLLNQWEAERRRGIEDAVTFTKINGMLCNEPESWGFYFFRHLEWMYSVLPLMPATSNRRTIKEGKGFTGVRGGFFLPEFRGGWKLAQVFVQTSEGKTCRSDELLQRSSSLLTLLVVGPGSTSRCEKARTILRSLDLPKSIISEYGFLTLDPDASKHCSEGVDNAARFLGFRTTAPDGDDGDTASKDNQTYLNRLGPSTVYAILRPDFYIFAALKSASELESCLSMLKSYVATTNDKGARELTRCNL